MLFIYLRGVLKIIIINYKIYKWYYEMLYFVIPFLFCIFALYNKLVITMSSKNYKVGNKVRVKSLDWYLKNCNSRGNVECSHGYSFLEAQSVLCGAILTIDHVWFYSYRVAENNFAWTDEMFEYIIEDMESNENMKYKIGDKVLIKSLNWYNASHNKHGEVKMEKYANNTFYFTEDHSEWCGRIMTISNVYERCYIMEEDCAENDWTDSMIDCLVVEPEVSEPTTEEFIETLTENMFEDKSDNPEILSLARYGEDIYAYKIPEGYEFYAVYNGEIQLKKKKIVYPKTYAECCYVTGFVNTELVFEDDYRDINPPIEQWKRLGLINQFNKLLICLDAYWKIAGEEMGLGKPWEPDYTNAAEKKFAIWIDFGEIKLGGAFTTTQMVLSFPTEEMRDVFYENFKELIEECKNLL